MKIIYKCDICKRELDYKRYRIQEQKFTAPPYSRAIKILNVDLCLPCYKRYLKWIKEQQEIFKDV